MAGLDSVAAYMDAARRILPTHGFEALFPDGPLACTWRNNVAALEEVTMRSRVLAGHRTRSIDTTVLGRRIALPVIVAPTGAQQRLHPEGEVATGLGAAKAGTIMSVSSLSSFGLNEVASTATAGRWFQLYLTKDRAISRALVQIAESAGYDAIMLTVDNVASLQISDDASASRAARDAREQAFWSTGHGDSRRALRIFAELPASVCSDALSLADLIDPAPTWRDVEWLASITRLPIIVKGIQTAEDALECAPAGARGIVVSNHGGASPSMEGLPGSIRALPEVAEAVAGNIEIFFDGGIRCGQDVLKALALGARAVLVGRAVLWGLATDGAEGVASVLGILRRELEMAMAICGVADVQSVPRSAVNVSLLNERAVQEIVRVTLARRLSGSDAR